MGDKVQIALCMGNSCFARGNNAMLETLESLIEANGWKQRVALSGLRCENHCSGGPNIKIDGRLYHGMDVGTLHDLLKHRLDATAGEETK